MTALINTEKYPIDKPEFEAYTDLVLNCRERLALDGLLNLEEFLKPFATKAIAKELDQLLPGAFHSQRLANAYGSAGPNEFSPDHPYNIKAATDRYGLARHQLKGSLLDEIYQWKPVRRFVGDVLHLDQVFLHEDPCNALVVQIYKKNGGLAWHFDKALFSTILNIRESMDGGVFECAPNIRNNEDECFNEVRQVLKNSSHRIKQYKVKAGSFTIMNGRHTLHRVTENNSEIPRLSAVLSYEDRPGVKLDSRTRQLFFGPSAPLD